ncbi:mechan s in 12 species: Archae - 0 [Striga asiatica]|uniref:Mechan s in 12 species: Archae-0 n=1 Tax=Striga asiatica TaxID=4170 RepID=A0A5A7PKX4_STRAF|nr:mechan s in 12 species: Archae - 0 [Striga asiatica]
MTNKVTGGCYLETRKVSGKGRMYVDRFLSTDKCLKKKKIDNPQFEHITLRGASEQCGGAVQVRRSSAAEQYRCVGAVQVCRVRRGATIGAARVIELWETRGAAVAGEERKIAQRERENKLSPERRGEERRESVKMGAMKK